MSTDGITKVGENDVGYLPLYKGTYTPQNGLEGVVICDEAETDTLKNEYPNYYAFDVFLRNYSGRKTENDVLQLNYTSSAEVLKNSLIKTRVIDGVTTDKIYVGDAESGLQNTIRLGMALYEDTAKVTDNGDIQ